MFPGLSRHVRYECCAVDLQEVSTQQGRTCRDAESNDAFWKLRIWRSQPGDVGLCALLACVFAERLCCGRFVDSSFFSRVAKTCAFESRQTKKSLKIWHVALCCFEEALFCCCLGGLPLCGQWRVGKHGKKSTERWRITGITWNYTINIHKLTSQFG